MLLGIVHARNERYANDEGRIALTEHVCVPENRRVVHAAEMPVHGRIGQLHVHHDEIDGVHHAGEHLIGSVSAGLNGGVQSAQMRDDFFNEVDYGCST